MSDDERVKILDALNDIGVFPESFSDEETDVELFTISLDELETIVDSLQYVPFPF